jgi:hypothetical protein
MWGNSWIYAGWAFLRSKTNVQNISWFIVDCECDYLIQGSVTNKGI